MWKKVEALNHIQVPMTKKVEALQVLMLKIMGALNHIQVPMWKKVETLQLLMLKIDLTHLIQVIRILVIMITNSQIIIMKPVLANTILHIVHFK